MTRAEVEAWRALRAAGHTVAAIARTSGRPYTTVYEWVKAGTTRKRPA